MWNIGQLYLVAWDISDPARLRRVRRRVSRHWLDGQKSVCECRMTDSERHELLHDVAALIDPEADSFLVFPLDPRAGHEHLGRPVPLWTRILEYFG